MKHIKTYILPIAIILGFLCHNICDTLKFLLPYLIFLILFFNFIAVDVKKMHFKWLYFWFLLYQICVSLGAYAICTACGLSEVISQGVFVGVICPVAASVVVVACMLGANRETVTSYTIINNLTLSFVIPFTFSFIGQHQEMPFLESFSLIIVRVGSVIGLPFFLALFISFLLPKWKPKLSVFTNYTFYIWAVAFFITIGQTIDYVFLHGKGNGVNMMILAFISLIFCILQFYIGKKMGSRYGDPIAGGQLMAQKNTAMGIWMANTYLHPLASVFLACYSIWQNLFNSYQIYLHDKKELKQ